VLQALSETDAGPYNGLSASRGSEDANDMPSFMHDRRKLHYTLEGTGSVLLFVHGLGGNAENWRLQRAAFTSSHRVVALDLPGHGRSEGGNVRFKLYWKAIRTLCDHLDTQRITICGLSKGARAALMFAARHPDRGRPHCRHQHLRSPELGGQTGAAQPL
jgi:pimeloyl-ACP methyl ester carboxylesterase